MRSNYNCLLSCVFSVVSLSRWQKWWTTCFSWFSLFLWSPHGRVLTIFWHRPMTKNFVCQINEIKKKTPNNSFDGNFARLFPNCLEISSQTISSSALFYWFCFCFSIQFGYVHRKCVGFFLCSFLICMMICKVNNVDMHKVYGLVNKIAIKIHTDRTCTRLTISSAHRNLVP